MDFRMRISGIFDEVSVIFDEVSRVCAATKDSKGGCCENLKGTYKG